MGADNEISHDAWKRCAAIMDACKPWVIRNKGCEIRPSSDELALFATCHFGQGDPILEEHPALIGRPQIPDSVPDEVKQLTLEPEIQLSADEWAAALQFAFNTMECNHFEGAPIACLGYLAKNLGIYAGIGSAKATLIREKLSKLSIDETLKESLALALLMMLFSSMGLSGSWKGGRALYGMQSKSNHSCFPNCVLLSSMYPPGEEAYEGGFCDDIHDKRKKPPTQFRAIVDIKPGDELTWCYLGPCFPINVPSIVERRTKLRRSFEFECMCPLCEPPPGSQAPSRGALCKRALAYGKPPPIPPGGLRGPPAEERAQLRKSMANC